MAVTCIVCFRENTGNRGEVLPQFPALLVNGRAINHFRAFHFLGIPPVERESTLEERNHQYRSETLYWKINGFDDRSTIRTNQIVIDDGFLPLPPVLPDSFLPLFDQTIRDFSREERIPIYQSSNWPTLVNHIFLIKQSRSSETEWSRLQRELPIYRTRHYLSIIITSLIYYRKKGVEITINRYRRLQGIGEMVAITCNDSEELKLKVFRIDRSDSD